MWSENPREDVCIDVTAISNGFKVLDWIQMVQHIVQWWALVNTALNLRLPLKERNFLTL
jgi:hypothetical protein